MSGLTHPQPLISHQDLTVATDKLQMCVGPQGKVLQWASPINRKSLVKFFHEFVIDLRTYNSGFWRTGMNADNTWPEMSAAIPDQQPSINALLLEATWSR